MKRFYKIYLEITNVCNLRCSFCPGTRRRPHAMTREEFTALLPRLRPYTDYLYFHIMGEPLCHPRLEEYLALAHEAGFRVILTTNGTLLREKQDMLLRSPGLHKVNISLHSFEANEGALSLEEYLQRCVQFGKAAQGQKIVCYRLWNGGGADALNSRILSLLREHFPQPWEESRGASRIGNRVFIAYADKFDWPDLTASDSGTCFCYGLRDHIGVLCDGTVVPCCLDHEGDIPLGNLHEQTLEEILNSPRAKAIYDGFSRRTAVEPLCRKCGYASRF